MLTFAKTYTFFNEIILVYNTCVYVFHELRMFTCHM